jgi:2-methoxy-6-polyprenyl-1,4-benzoquinol methylase
MRSACVSLRFGELRRVRCFSSSSSDDVSFGFKTVKREEKQKQVNEVFARVAESYDRMNDAMSVGIHRAWKDQFVKMLGPVPGCRVLDLAGGTGDISFRIIEALKERKRENFNRTNKDTSEVILSDINPNMLEVGEDRARKLGYLSTQARKTKNFFFFVI